MTSKLRGTVTFDGDSHIASNSTAYISINDVSRACAPSIKIGILFEIPLKTKLIVIII